MKQQIRHVEAAPIAPPTCVAATARTADDVRVGVSAGLIRWSAAAIVSVVVSGCAPVVAHNEAAGPLPIASGGAGPVADAATPLQGRDWRVEEIANGRVVVSRSPRGQATTIELRSASDPKAVVYRVTDPQATGGIYCVSLSAAWLVRTDLTAVPSRLIPGPPQPWTLVATNLSTGERVVLDRGMTDMARGFACPVAHDTQLAWSSGHQQSTTVFDLTARTARHVLVPGNPVGWDGDGVLLAQYTKRTARVLRITPGSASPPMPVLATTRVDQLRAVAGRLVWWARDDPYSDNFHTRLYACRISDCQVGDLPSHQLASLNVDLGWTAVSSEVIAWTSAGQDVPPLRILRLDDGSSIRNLVNSEVWPLAADGNTIAFISTPLGQIAPMTLHVLQIT